MTVCQTDESDMMIAEKSLAQIAWMILSFKIHTQPKESKIIDANSNSIGRPGGRPETGRTQCALGPGRKTHNAATLE
jgi:hypothetical protein